jgi:FkbM family methyltransferase
MSGTAGERARTDDATDFRRSALGRRRSWYGLKRHVKRVLSWRIPHRLVRGLARIRPSLARSGRLPAPSSLREVTGGVSGATFVMLRPDRCVVAKELYWGNGRRPRPEDAFALELFATMARRSDVALDIGAYTGIFTLGSAAVNPGIETHAFEIVPEVFRALFDNCVRNDVLERVTLHPTGVGEEGARMLVPASSSDSALPSFYSERLSFESGTHVRFESLDSLAGTFPSGARVVAKIDVEGTENVILRNGQGFLSSFRPDLLCEVLHGVADGEELEALLAPHGYRFYLVRERDLFPAARIEPSARFRDWFLTPRAAGELGELGIPVSR